MNLMQLRRLQEEGTPVLAPSHATQRHASDMDFQPRGMSRRHFARTAAGSVVAGVALGSGLWRPRLAGASGSGTPPPIPGGTPALGDGFHIFGPAPDGGLDPIDAEPSAINDFNGFVGLASISGQVTQTNTATG